jgi:hypothetical protein
MLKCRTEEKYFKHLERISVNQSPHAFGERHLCGVFIIILTALTQKESEAMLVEQLSKDEQRIVMHAIRQFGKGGHALPNKQNVVFFTSQYASQCLRQALKEVIIDVQERKQIADIVLKLRD